MKSNKTLIYISFLFLILIGIGNVNATTYQIAKTVPNMTYLDCNSTAGNGPGYAIIPNSDLLRSNNLSKNVTIELIYKMNPYDGAGTFNTLISKGSVGGSSPYTGSEYDITRISTNNVSTKMYVFNRSNFLDTQGLNTTSYNHLIYTMKNIPDNNGTISYQIYQEGVLKNSGGTNNVSNLSDYNKSIRLCHSENFATDQRFQFNGTLTGIKIYNYYFSDVDSLNTYTQSQISSDSDIEIVSLMLHRIIDDNATLTTYDLNVTDLRNKLTFFKQLGYESITYNQYYSWRYNNSFSMPKKAIIITFDDGSYGGLINAKPVLDSLGYVGVVAIITNSTNNSVNPVSYSDVLTWANVTTLHNAGWEIASHTYSHDAVFTSSTNQTYRFLQYNLSKQMIYDYTGITATTLIYPGNTQNAGNRTECLLFYTGCSGNAVYSMTTPRFIYKTTNMINDGLMRFEIQSNDTISELNSLFNVTNRYNLVLSYDFDNSTGNVTDKSQYNNNITFTNVTVKTDGATKIKLYTSNLNTTKPYLNNNLPTTLTSLNATYDDSLKLVNLTCSGTGNINLNNLNTLGSSYRVYHNGVLVTTSSNSTYTINSCSEWLFIGNCAYLNTNYTFNYNVTNPTCFINNYTSNIALNLTNYVNGYPFNDIKNTSNGVILASNVNNYSLTLTPNQQIEVGNFSYISATSLLTTSNTGILPGFANLTINITDPDSVFNNVTIVLYDRNVNVVQSNNSRQLNNKIEYDNLDVGTYYYRFFIYTNRSETLSSTVTSFRIDGGSGSCDDNAHALWLLIPLIILAGFLLWLWMSVEGGLFKDVSFIIALIIIIQLIVNLITVVKAGC